MRIKSPFEKGDAVKFCKTGSGYPIGTRCIVIATGYETYDNRSGRAPFRVKISLGSKKAWWSAAWFVKVGPNVSKKKPAK